MNIQGTSPSEEELKRNRQGLPHQSMPVQVVRDSRGLQNNRPITSGGASTFGQAGVPTSVSPDAIPKKEKNEAAEILKLFNESSMSSVTDASGVVPVKGGYIIQDKDGKPLNTNPVTFDEVKRMSNMGHTSKKPKKSLIERPQGLRNIQLPPFKQLPSEMGNEPFQMQDPRQMEGYISPEQVEQIREQRKYGNSPYSNVNVQNDTINRGGLAKDETGATVFDNAYMRNRYGKGVQGGLGGNYRSDNDPKQLKARKEAQEVHKRRVALNEQQEFDRNLRSMKPAERIAALNQRNASRGLKGMTANEAATQKLNYAKHRFEVQQANKPKREAWFKPLYSVDPNTGFTEKVGEEYAGFIQDGELYTNGNGQQVPMGFDNQSAKDQKMILDIYDKMLKSKNLKENKKKFFEDLSKRDITESDIKNKLSK